jgi:hypothetical protein
LLDGLVFRIATLTFIVLANAFLLIAPTNVSADPPEFGLTLELANDYPLFPTGFLIRGTQSNDDFGDTHRYGVSIESGLPELELHGQPLRLLLQARSGLYSQPVDDSDLQREYCEARFSSDRQSQCLERVSQFFTNDYQVSAGLASRPDEGVRWFILASWRLLDSGDPSNPISPTQTQLLWHQAAGFTEYESIASDGSPGHGVEVRAGVSCREQESLAANHVILLADWVGETEVSTFGVFEVVTGGDLRTTFQTDGAEVGLSIGAGFRLGAHSEGTWASYQFDTEIFAGPVFLTHRFVGFSGTPTNEERFNLPSVDDGQWDTIEMVLIGIDFFRFAARQSAN